MRLKYFYPDENDTVKFTKEELEKLLNDVYEEGKEDGRNSVNPYHSTPWITTTPYYYNTKEITNTPNDTITKIWCTSKDNTITLSTKEN